MIKINLLATREAKKKETMQMQVVGAVFALLLTVGVVGYFHINMNNKIEDIKNEIKTVKKDLESLNKIKIKLTKMYFTSYEIN